ncbi:thioredoxin family protein [Listeria ivanovii]|uniref:Thioredoxin n=2 Tax=Listeria ivanovii TaxID=1638 RepID=A0ABS1G2A8_LISIV|nr:thioredoxin family protein [Listeria ivanovii]EFR95546.1 thioredoxin [Listeria ivanovii FSL F6-596]AIS58488.1 thioredoxin [Listeria ivanovii subsp. londoniensis]AIS61242.1 thioredoxin [Listeria ivanovii subsp. londoniensis]MBC2255417.1 thioredoxin family protein [Listeria ivanovii]MBK1960997.1 thioredoxin family protein [Listeria ivanovii subsp. londoniensis]
MAIIFAKEENLEEIISSHPKILLNFWAEWCAPCRCFWSTLEQFSEVEEGNIQVVKINVDRERALAQQFDVKGIPNSLVLVDGEIKGAIAGIVSCEELRSRFRSLVK